MLVAFSGGVGGARMAYGLNAVVGPERLLVAVNVGDDFDYLDLAISPDIDTVCYTLAEREDADRGWGLTGETWRFMETLSALGYPGWFRLGDADLALHMVRTQLRADGASLSTVTKQICKAMGVSSQVLPVTDDPIETLIHSDAGVLGFQDYFVRLQCQPRAHRFEYKGASEAVANPVLMEALADTELEAVIFCPSNPWLSIRPMLAIPRIEAALQSCRAPLIVVSPIVNGAAIKGPAGKLMTELGLSVSALEIARLYAGLADGIVIDRTDAALRSEIESLGMSVLVANTVMHDRADRVRLAAEILDEEWL